MPALLSEIVDFCDQRSGQTAIPDFEGDFNPNYENRLFQHLAHPIT